MVGPSTGVGLIGGLIDCLGENATNDMGIANKGSSTKISSLEVATATLVFMAIEVGTVGADESPSVDGLGTVCNFFDA